MSIHDRSKCMKRLLSKLLKIAKVDSVEAVCVNYSWTFIAKANWRMYHLYLDNELLPLSCDSDVIAEDDERTAEFLVMSSISSGKAVVIDEFQDYDCWSNSKWVVIPRTSSIEELEVWADLHEVHHD